MTDLPGKAIYDYHFQKNRGKLFVHDRFGPKVEMPVKLYFRDYPGMPILERAALKHCLGKVLDVGAGAGSHALELQKKGFEVAALEISPSACEVMKDRNVEKVVCKDFFEFNDEKFDTLLLLMNGIGLCGTMDGFTSFLDKAGKILNPGGQIIFDSCDVSYMFEDCDLPKHYFGEVECRYEYGREFTEWFKWLYLDKEKMQETASDNGWASEVLAEDEDNQYLAVLRKK